MYVISSLHSVLNQLDSISVITSTHSVRAASESQLQREFTKRKLTFTIVIGELTREL